MPIKPSSAKAKGRRLQQKVAAAILETFPSLRSADVVSTSMGAPGEDVHLSTAARSLVPLSFECKNTERLNLWAALEQCGHNCPPSASPCVVFSKNNAKTYACVEFEVLLKLLAAAAAPPDSAAAASDDVKRRILELAALVTDQKSDVGGDAAADAAVA